MQVICTSLQTDNHASTSSLHIFTGVGYKARNIRRNDKANATSTELSVYGSALASDTYLAVEVAADGLLSPWLIVEVSSTFFLRVARDVGHRLHTS